ncbi:hypothetical protein ACLOAV_006621 [Pseudogymnoascus australis]
MPITFGSVGDIISVSVVIKDLVQALRESRGSAAEYQEIIRELSILDRVFLEVEQLSGIKGQGTELNVLYTTTDHIINECRKCLRNFLEKCQKYDASLGEGKKENLVRGVSRKIQWRLVERHELDRFRSEINTHSSCLNILLATANAIISDASYRRLEGRQAAAEERTQADLLAQKTMLEHIQDRLQENTQLVASISSNAASIASLLKLGWLRRMGFVVKEYLADIMTVNMSIYQTVIRIQAAIPYNSQGPITDIFMLEDAIGRTTPVTLQFINSWDAFDNVLETRFRNLPGHLKILHKEFVLQERATMREISRIEPWEGAILPGQKIDMSMVFTDTRSETRMPCPGCSHTCDNYSDAGTQCINCGMSFSRIIDLSDSDDGQPPYLSQSTISQSTKVRNSHNSQTKDTHSRNSSFNKTASSTRGFGPNRLPVIHGEQLSRGTGVQPKDEISRYKRVIIICRRRNQTMRSFAFATAGQQADLENRIYLDSFREKERELGARHPETILAMVMLAKNYQIRNRFKAAKELLRGALHRDEGFLQSRPDAVETACRVLIAISIDENCLNETKDVCQRLLELARLQADDPETQLPDIVQLQEIYKAINIDGTPRKPNEDDEPTDTDYMDNHSLAPLSDNVYNYNVENGRTYHNLNHATYHLPNDEREQERLDLQHNAIILLVDEPLFLSPIKDPKAILDQGTGTGIWAIDAGDAYPAAQVYGTDISPIQPSFVPPNVQFIIDDIELTWTYDENSFDLIHSCMGNAFSSRDWDHFLTESRAKLAPGGWVEIKDIDFHPLSQNFSLPLDSYIVRWHELLEEASSLAGNVNFRFDAARLADRLQNLGFINITIKTFRLPLGRLQGDQKSKTTSAWWREVLNSSLEPFSMALFTRFLGWSALEVVQFLEDIRVEMSNVAYHWDWQL